MTIQRNYGLGGILRLETVKEYKLMLSIKGTVDGF